MICISLVYRYQSVLCYSLNSPPRVSSAVLHSVFYESPHESHFPTVSPLHFPGSQSLPTSPEPSCRSRSLSVHSPGCRARSFSLHSRFSPLSPVSHCHSDGNRARSLSPHSRSHSLSPGSHSPSPGSRSHSQSPHCSPDSLSSESPLCSHSHLSMHPPSDSSDSSEHLQVSIDHTGLGTPRIARSRSPLAIGQPRSLLRGQGTSRGVRRYRGRGTRTGRGIASVSRGATRGRGAARGRGAVSHQRSLPKIQDMQGCQDQDMGPQV